MAQQVQALVNYYAREGFYRHIQTVCNEVLKKRSNEPVQLFWRAYSLILEGTYSEALRELRPLVSQGQEVEVAAIAASIYAHRLAKIVDEEAVMELETRLLNEERNASERKLLHTAMFYWHTGSVEKAKGMVERVMRIQPNYTQGKTLMGWIELTPSSADDEDEYMHAVRTALGIFNDVLSGEGAAQKELEAMLGKAKCLEKLGDIAEALNMLNYIVVQYSWFVPALEEKARLLIMTGDWENAVEVAQRILAADNQNIEALKITVLYLLMRESKIPVAAKSISNLLESCDRNEPKNASLYHRIAQPIARLAGQNAQLLKLAMTFSDRARKCAPESCEFLCEFAYQQMLAGDYQGSMSSYRAATALDELSTASMYGTIHCQLLDGQLEDAAGQLEFLAAVSTSVEPAVEVLFMQALLAWKRDRDAPECLRLLDDGARSHLGALQGRPQTAEHVVALNPQLLMDMAQLYLQQCGADPRSPTEPSNPALRSCLAVLESLGRAAPGLLEGQLLLARANYLGGNMDDSARAISHILRIDGNFAQAHVLMAQIHLFQNKPKLAGQSLDQAAAQDFSARDTPAYCIVKSKVLLHDMKEDEALQVLEHGMQIPGVRKPGGKGGAHVALSERVSIYLLLAEARSKLGKIPEATKIIQDALNEFAGSPEEVRVMISNCELSLSRGDIEGGLSMLRAIPRDSPHYVRAKMAMADIYLKHRNDKAMYASCYLDLVEKYPDVQTYMMLGEAFMQIQEPEKAIKAFESALNRQDRKDPTLACKIGRALITTHDYRKAVDYYERAVQSDPSNLPMQHELAELYFKLKRFDHAQRVLSDALAAPKSGDVSDSLATDVQNTLLLAKVLKGQGRNEEFATTMAQANEVQGRLLNRLRGEQPDAVRKQKELAADICFTVAQEFDKQKMYDEAGLQYQEAIKHCDTHTKSMVRLARIHLMKGDTDACQQQCVSLLRQDPDNEEASMMLAELMFCKEHYTTAIYHYQQLLDRKANHYVALGALVQLLRRAGRVDEIPRYLRAAEKSSVRAAHDAGLFFCKGLHERYNNNLHEALRCFNQARKSGEWGQKAIFNMVEIYLNPDNEAVWEEAAESGRPTDNAEAVRAAEKLLKEVRGAPDSKFQVLQAYAMMATKSKTEIDAALNLLTDLANQVNPKPYILNPRPETLSPSKTEIDAALNCARTSPTR
mmetsp:Transcript_26568/g.85189  ORF Transcript_26568/g.85189 Transcript_26568/m.85189 type:complete len:1185 (+) Transcript_26568:168-3722(+)